MSAQVKLVLVQEAYDDILRRSLSKLPCDLGRLIYLASTRDYNAGSYHHEGLSNRYSPEVAAKALEIAHRQVFYKVSAYSLEELVEEVQIYFRSSREEPQKVLRTCSGSCLPISHWKSICKHSSRDLRRVPIVYLRRPLFLDAGFLRPEAPVLRFRLTISIAEIAAS